MVDVTINPRSLGVIQQRLDQLDKELTRQLKQANHEIGEIAVAESRRLLQAEVYAVPIPRTREGKPKWERNREMLQGERYRLTPDGTRVILYNVHRHAGARAALGDKNPPNRANRRAGVQRPQTGPASGRSRTRPIGNYHRRVVAVLRPQIRERYREAIRRMIARRK